MRRVASLFLLTSAVAIASAQDARESQLWKANISPLLAAPLWSSPARAYSAGHVLMVPLHAAFSTGNDAWEREFAAQFAKYMADGKDQYTEWGTPVRLNYMQYLYLHTRFGVLAAQAKKTDLIPAGMLDWISNLLDRLWTSESSITYGRAACTGMKERLQYKLSLRNPAKSYYRAIIDEERYLFAEAADLRAYERITGKKLPHSETLTDILDSAREVFRTRGREEPGGGWIFEPGVWSDHPDYQYAGNAEKVTGMSASPRPGIGEDTSHSHRMALWLTSLAEAYPESSSDRRFYEDLRSKLEKQFFNRVLIEPTGDFKGYRTTNYMDGSNGVYRYNYKALGAGNGYGGYELSGTFLLGWWTFLGTDRIHRAYEAQAKLYPLDENALRVYLGGSGAEKVDAAMENPKKFNDLRELLCRLAAKTGG